MGFEIRMAFQPIVRASTRGLFGHEALVRGANREPAAEIFKFVNDGNRYKFDQACRTQAIQQASELGIDNFLSINFLPNAVYRPELCIQTTLRAASRFRFPLEQIIFEFTEGEKVTSVDHLKSIIEYYKSSGFKTAIDDFGAGFSGLNLLAEMQPDIVKIDMELIRGIDRSRPRRAILQCLVKLCAELRIEMIAEGIETRDEFRVLQSFGIDLYQGYYFAKPAFASLAEVSPEVFEDLGQTPAPNRTLTLQTS